MALSVASSVPTDLVHPATPTSQPAVLDDLSPPSSQGGVSLYPSTPAAPGNPSMPSVAASASGANANGKRPLETLDGIAESTLASSEGGTAVAQTQPQIRAQQIHTHDASGYTWTKPEHAPGYAWSNRKAVEEAARAWETGVVAKERAIKSEPSAVCALLRDAWLTCDALHRPLR